MIGLKKEKKKKTNVEKKETHIDNRGFGFRLKFVLIFFFFILYMADKASLFFWRKIKDKSISTNKKANTILALESTGCYSNISQLNSFN